ncbi:hypothetical protein PG990_004917 [Apiospora arundinis]
MNDPIDALGHYFGIDPLSSDLKSPFDEPNPTTNDSMFAADDYLLDLGPFSGPDFSCTTQHTHDDGCPIRCPEDTNSSSQYRGVAPPVPSSYAKGRAVSVSYPPFGYGHDSHLYSASGQLGFEQMMGWASQDPKQEPDDGFKFFHGYGAECSGTGCPARVLSRSVPGQTRNAQPRTNAAKYPVWIANIAPRLAMTKTVPI